MTVTVTNPGLAVDAQKIPKADAYGGILIKDGTHILLREPANHFGGYVWTFPKGRPDPGESPSQTALREVQEETGYKAKILFALSKAFKGDTSNTSFFVMEPVGNQGEFGSETWQTKWVTPETAKEMIALTKSRIGKRRDLDVVNAICLALKIC